MITLKMDKSDTLTIANAFTHVSIADIGNKIGIPLNSGILEIADAELQLSARLKLGRLTTILRCEFDGKTLNIQGELR